MGYLHKSGIIHRDVKPENILFAQSVQANVETKDMQQAYNVKLIDLGMSASFNPDVPTKGAVPLSHLFGFITDTHMALLAQPLLAILQNKPTCCVSISCSLLQMAHRMSKRCHEQLQDAKFCAVRQSVVLPASTYEECSAYQCTMSCVVCFGCV